MRSGDEKVVCYTQSRWPIHSAFSSLRPTKGPGIIPLSRRSRCTTDGTFATESHAELLVPFSSASRSFQPWVRALDWNDEDMLVDGRVKDCLEKEKHSLQFIREAICHTVSSFSASLLALFPASFYRQAERSWPNTYPPAATARGAASLRGASPIPLCAKSSNDPVNARSQRKSCQKTARKLD